MTQHGNTKTFFPLIDAVPNCSTPTKWHCADLVSTVPHDTGFAFRGYRRNTRNFAVKMSLRHGKELSKSMLIHSGYRRTNYKTINVVLNSTIMDQQLPYEQMRLPVGRYQLERIKFQKNI